MRTMHWIRAVAVLSLASLIALPMACRSGGRSEELTSVSDDGQQTAPLAAGSDAPIRQAGALAWSQNCMRCHNLRIPRERSDREWDAIVFHMRVRANLTAEEHRLILRFLQSAN